MRKLPVSTEKHGAGVIAKRGRVQGLPTGPSEASPGRGCYNRLQPGSVYATREMRYNRRNDSRLTFARIIMRGKLALQLAAVGRFVLELT
jgi:hypothetical protein